MTSWSYKQPLQKHFVNPQIKHEQKPSNISSNKDTPKNIHWSPHERETPRHTGLLVTKPLGEVATKDKKAFAKDQGFIPIPSNTIHPFIPRSIKPIEVLPLPSNIVSAGSAYIKKEYPTRINQNTLTIPVVSFNERFIPHNNYKVLRDQNRTMYLNGVNPLGHRYRKQPSKDPKPSNVGGGDDGGDGGGGGGGGYNDSDYYDDENDEDNAFYNYDDYVDYGEYGVRQGPPPAQQHTPSSDDPYWDELAEAGVFDRAAFPTLDLLNLRSNTPPNFSTLDRLNRPPNSPPNMNTNYTVMDNLFQTPKSIQTQNELNSIRSNMSSSTPLIPKTPRSKAPPPSSAAPPSSSTSTSSTSLDPNDNNQMLALDNEFNVNNDRFFQYIDRHMDLLNNKDSKLVRLMREYLTRPNPRTMDTYHAVTRDQHRIMGFISARMQNTPSSRTPKRKNTDSAKRVSRRSEPKMSSERRSASAAASRQSISGTPFRRSSAPPNSARRTSRSSETTQSAVPRRATRTRLQFDTKENPSPLVTGLPPNLAFNTRKSRSKKK
jgi:hypothetical protein